MFHFCGPLESSKSWMNRALILQSFDRSVAIDGISSSDDVQLLYKALKDFSQGGTEFYAGLGGTTFRFLALRLSREVGNFFIRAEKELLSRPQIELLNVFSQLGVRAEIKANGLEIDSSGWKEHQGILKISTRESSQFLSATLLSAVDLHFDLHIAIEDEVISEDYFKYTLNMLEEAGLKTIQFEDSIFLKKNQKITTRQFKSEVDVSSAFSLMAAAALAGSAEIENWKSSSAQPDMQFLQFFKKMKIDFIQTETSLKVKQHRHLSALEADLGHCPDLFPVLSVLCAFASGESHLYGASQLKYKESDRIAKTAELLAKCGFQVKALDDGIKIQGEPDLKYNLRKEILFDPDHDHRMAMAAAILKLKEFPLRWLDPEVINKSYPHFYQHIGLDI